MLNDFETKAAKIAKQQGIANLAAVTEAKAFPKDACAECSEIPGATWVHLDMCRICGHVGCCDNSPNTHATKHYHATGHAIIQRYEPGEDWGFDYETGETFEPFPKEIASNERHSDWDAGYVPASKAKGRRATKVFPPSSVSHSDGW
jgi:hypothetical protein